MPSVVPRKPGMVGWFSILQLSKDVGYYLLSTMLGSMVDTRRVVFGGEPYKDCFFDYVKDGNEEDKDKDFWFDYMADTGDGWDATYTMAYLVSSESVKPDRVDRPLPRGTFLILGGDEVYPRATSEEYARRLVWPFNQAARKQRQIHSPPGVRVKLSEIDAKDRRDVYCIPGNHDWYDNLQSFSARICRGDSDPNRIPIGSFRTRQARSYFVLELPHGWQLWAADVQFRHDIDVEQLAFFRERAEKLPAHTRVILCLAVSDLVSGKDNFDEPLEYSICQLIELVEGRESQVVLQIAGDIHNYQRYIVNQTAGPNPYPRTKIVSGGGGAFLHPNHGFGKTVCAERYPTEKTSQSLTRRNWLLPWYSWSMAVLFAVVYALMFWNVPVSVQDTELWSTVRGVFALPLLDLVALFVTATLFVGLGIFARSGEWETKTGGLLAGVIHALVHLVVAGVGAIVFTWVAGKWLGCPFGLLAARIVAFLPAGALGATIFGGYHWVALNRFGAHKDTAFSALRIAQYKHFLRFCLSARGLRCYVVGVENTKGEEEDHPVKTHLVEQFDVPLAPSTPQG